MKIAVSVPELARELAFASRIAPRKPALAALGGVLLTAEPGVLTLAATDTEIAVRIRIPAQVEHLGSALLPAQTFSDLVRTLSPGDVILASDKAAVTVTAGAFRGRLPGLPADDFPVLLEPQAAEAAMLPSALVRAMVRRTRFATAEDERYYLLGAMIQADGAVLRMVATDAKRLAVVEAASTVTVPETLLPKKALDALASFAEGADDAVGLSVGENHIFLTVANRLLISRMVEGKYPAWRRLLPPEAPGYEVGRADLIAAIRRAGLVADAETRHVRFALDAALNLASESSASGRADETVPIVAQSGAEPRTFGLNVGFVGDFLDAAETDVVTVQQHADKGAVIWRERMPDAVYTYLTMPVLL